MLPCRAGFINFLFSCGYGVGAPPMMDSIWFGLIDFVAKHPGGQNCRCVRVSQAAIPNSFRAAWSDLEGAGGEQEGNACWMRSRHRGPSNLVEVRSGVELVKTVMPTPLVSVAPVSVGGCRTFPPVPRACANGLTIGPGHVSVGHRRSGNWLFRLDTIRRRHGRIESFPLARCPRLEVTTVLPANPASDWTESSRRARRRLDTTL
jgi:hypothetical protein